ncbi:MAG: amidohydrolase family protein [Spirochaetaceae bacterium]|jgi:predicted amidohydrolase YtcJ|nr:amidohydrolase family protein [Spirochaetaceae bacterium]
MCYADAIFVNGNIYTLDDDKPRARALALWKGEFLAAGDREDCEAFKGPGTRVIDLEGRTVLPGFNDTHCHLLSLRGQQLLQLDCSSGKVKSIDDILGIIKKAAETTPEGQWILGGSLDPAKLAEKRPPTRGELDTGSPRPPVQSRAQS